MISSFMTSNMPRTYSENLEWIRTKNRAKSKCVAGRFAEPVRSELVFSRKFSEGACVFILRLN